MSTARLEKTYFNYGLNVEERTFLNLEVKAVCRSQFDSL